MANFDEDVYEAKFKEGEANDLKKQKAFLVGPTQDELEYRYIKNLEIKNGMR